MVADSLWSYRDSGHAALCFGSGSRDNGVFRKGEARGPKNECAPDSIESRDARSNSPPPKPAHHHLRSDMFRGNGSKALWGRVASQPRYNKETILNLGEFHRWGAFIVVVGHVVDPIACL